MKNDCFNYILCGYILPPSPSLVLIEHFLGDLTTLFSLEAGREGAREGICNNDDFVPTLSRFFHQGLVDKARQMNYDDESRSKTQSISTYIVSKPNHDDISNVTTTTQKHSTNFFYSL